MQKAVSSKQRTSRLLVRYLFANRRPSPNREEILAAFCLLLTAFRSLESADVRSAGGGDLTSTLKKPALEEEGWSRKEISLKEMLVRTRVPAAAQDDGHDNSAGNP